MADSKSNSENSDLNEKTDNEEGEQKEEKKLSDLTLTGGEVIGNDETGILPSREEEIGGLESVQRYAKRIKSFLGWEPCLEEFENIVSSLSEDRPVLSKFDDTSEEKPVLPKIGDSSEELLAEGSNVGRDVNGRIPPEGMESSLEPQSDDSCPIQGSDSMELNVLTPVYKNKSDHDCQKVTNLECKGDDDVSELRSENETAEKKEMSSNKDSDGSGHNSNSSSDNNLENISVIGEDAMGKVNDSLQENDEDILKSAVSEKRDQEINLKSDINNEGRNDGNLEDCVGHENNTDETKKELSNSPDTENFNSKFATSENDLDRIPIDPIFQVDDILVKNAECKEVPSPTETKISEIIDAPERDTYNTETVPQSNQTEPVLASDDTVLDVTEIAIEDITIPVKSEDRGSDTCTQEENQDKLNKDSTESQIENVKKISNSKHEIIAFKTCDKSPYMDQVRRLSLDIVKYVIESATNSVNEMVANKNPTSEDAANGNLVKPIKVTNNGAANENKIQEEATNDDKKCKTESETDHYLYHTLNKSCEDIESKYKNSPVEFMDGKESMVDEDTVCGMGCFKPQFIQKYASPKVYLILFSIIGIVNGAYYSYMVSIISTLEKRYAFKTKVSGILLLSDEIMPLLFGIVVGYIGTKTHRPRMVATGMLIAASCSFISGIPYLIFGSAKHLQSVTYTNETGPDFCDTELKGKECDIGVSSPTVTVVVIFILASFLKGFGTLSYYVIGISYMDDNMKKKNSPMYLAIVFALRMLGPLVGFLMSSAFLKMYENPLDDPGYGPDDPRWIGAWWIGFFLQGIILVVVTLPIALFPRRLPGRKSMEKNTAPKSQDSWREIYQGLLAALKRLVKNPVFILLMIYMNAKIFSQFGHSIMLPKYMENQFRLSASEASLYSGATSVACIMIATVVGGFFIWKFRPGIKTLLRGILLSDFLMCIGFLLLMIPRCQPANMVNFGSNSEGLVLKGECNQICDCSTTSFTPFCGPDGKTFFSPCYAGCTQESTITSKSQKEFQNCSCVASPEAQTLNATISEGLCPDDNCWSKALIYLVIFLIVLSISNSFTVVYTMILLRSVHPNDKSIALGTFETFICLFGFIPFPIIGGALVDSACLVWEKSCGESGNCWFYDMDKFSYLLHGVSAAFCFLEVICVFILQFVSSRIRDLYADDDDEKTHVAKIKLDTVSESVTKL